mmetsp:Transcript_25533/g.35115  ORF Transcript_25533/g.35115 Transcript_25533/m.35115 type:complete len:85 (-) Transcript_25533:748-1002(-)
MAKLFIPTFSSISKSLLSPLCFPVVDFESLFVVVRDLPKKLLVRKNAENPPTPVLLCGVAVWDAVSLSEDENSRLDGGSWGFHI